MQHLRHLFGLSFTSSRSNHEAVMLVFSAFVLELGFLWTGWGLSNAQHPLFKWQLSYSNVLNPAEGLMFAESGQPELKKTLRGYSPCAACRAEFGLGWYNIYIYIYIYYIIKWITFFFLSAEEYGIMWLSRVFFCSKGNMKKKKLRTLRRLRT